MVFNTAANGCAGCEQEMRFEIVSMNLEACCGLDYYVLYSSGGPGSSVSWQAITNGPTGGAQSNLGCGEVAVSLISILRAPGAN
jgi:hypothetical protein